MTLIECELVMTPGADGPSPVVVADVPAPAATAMADAVRHERDAVARHELDADQALALRALSELADRLHPAPGAEMHVVRLGPDDAAIVSAAVERYLAERDTESYQPPEERARLAVLRDTRDALRDAQARLMLATLSADGQESPD